ncbi:MAG: O-antigen ligase family protein [Oscillospiraceae bacterium]|jgi:hypothetical protein|nr:O-antigen ligase family protein [Oscillospiraceae bacterium]
MDKPRARRVNPGFFLRLFDACSGVFVELFDPRLLTVSIAALMAYCTLFTQRKFPGRWMEYIALGMALVAIVAMAARTPDMRRRVRWYSAMPALWFTLHGWMLLSGFFYEDWLPESLALLVAFPFLFAVFTARDDRHTLYAVARGAVFGILPFLAWSYLAKPLVFGYPGWYGVFYNANGLAMCANMFTACASLLCYAAWQQGHKRAAIGYGALFLVGSLTVALTLSRSAWVAYAGAMLLLLGCILLRRTRRLGRVIALLVALVLVAGGALTYVTLLKVRRVAEEDWASALRLDAIMHWGINEVPPDQRTLTGSDFSSDRTAIWKQALTHLTWNGHPTAVVEEWVALDGGMRRLNAHNAFVAVAYNNGWPAGLLFLGYVALSAYRAWLYYWRHRKAQPMAIAPLLLTVLFILESLFESVYAPFSVVGCTYLLIQGVLWRENPAQEEEA